MRTLVRVIPDIDKGNEAIINGILENLIQQTVERLKPEAAFFYAENGRRAANFIFDMKDQSDIPSIAEPWFLKTNATVEFYPCMNVEDVRAGIAKAMAMNSEPVGV